jgi:hypothetical protein
MKGLFARVRSSLLVSIIFRFTKTLQLLTSIIKLNENIFTSIKVIKIMCTQIYKEPTVVKNAKLIKAWVRLKLIIALGLMK